MTILTSPSAVTVGSLTFGNVDDQTLTGWVYTNLEGWYDGPEVRTAFMPRPYAHGSFDATVFRGVRVITLTGTYVGLDHPSALAAAQQLNALLGDGSTGTVTVDSITSVVRLSAPPILSWLSGLDFAFQVSFTAVDPHKYGPTFTAGPVNMPSAGGGLVFPLFLVSGVMTWGAVPAPQIANLTNVGTAETSVIITVSAVGTALTGGFQIVETVTGSTITYVDDLPAGSSVVFDSSTGSVTLNGQADRRGSVTTAQWFQIPAGATRNVILQALTTFSSTATLTATARPAYW
jgi:hypothetical protein